MTHFRLSTEDSPKIENEMELITKVPYASAAAATIYAMVFIQSENFHIISVVNKYMRNLQKVH